MTKSGLFAVFVFLSLMCYTEYQKNPLWSYKIHNGCWEWVALQGEVNFSRPYLYKGKIKIDTDIEQMLPTSNHFHCSKKA